MNVLPLRAGDFHRAESAASFGKHGNDLVFFFVSDFAPSCNFVSCAARAETNITIVPPAKLNAWVKKHSYRQQIAKPKPFGWSRADVSRVGVCLSYFKISFR